MLLLSCHKCGTKKKNSESPWGIEPLTFRFHALMLYHWPTETLYFFTEFKTYHLSCSIYIYCVCHLNKTNQLIYGQQIKKLQLNSVLLISAQDQNKHWWQKIFDEIYFLFHWPFFGVFFQQSKQCSCYKRLSCYKESLLHLYVFCFKDIIAASFFALLSVLNVAKKRSHAYHCFHFLLGWCLEDSKSTKYQFLNFISIRLLSKLLKQQKKWDTKH